MAKNQGQQKRKFHTNDGSEQEVDWQTTLVKSEIVEDEEFLFDNGNSGNDIKPDIEVLQNNILQQEDLSFPPAKICILDSRKNIPTTSISSTSISNVLTIAKFFNEPFVSDEFDLQKSDSDEDGYSDIDLDDADDELIEDDTDSDPYDPFWSEKPTKPRLIFQFETLPKNVGLVEQPTFSNPEYYFDRMLGGINEFFTILADSTNKYVQQLFKSNNQAEEQIYLKKVSAEEMQIFMGICLQMSTIKFSVLADYWNKEASFGFEGFAQKMSLSRFQMLLKIVNLEKLSTKAEPSNVKLIPNTASIQALISFFNKRMETIFICGERLVLNDPIVFWKGKFRWSQDLNDHFRCNALKLHQLTESNELILKLLLDIDGKEKRKNVRNSRHLVVERLNLAKTLLKEKLSLGHTVLASKYYGSYALALELSQQKTYSVGYLDNKRYGNSKDLVLTQLQKGVNCVSIKYAAPLMMVKWRRHNKYVYFYNSDCLIVHAAELSRPDLDVRPNVVRELDWILKKSTTAKDNMINYQMSLNRQDIKWSVNLIIYIINLMLYNSFILYTMHALIGTKRRTKIPQILETKELKTYSEFRHHIIQKLLSATKDQMSSWELIIHKKTASNNQDSSDKRDTNVTNNDGASSSSVNNKQRQNLSGVVHRPLLIPRHNDKVMKKKCRICKKGGMLTFTKLYCERCPGFPGLCGSPCFKIWHNKLNK